MSGFSSAEVESRSEFVKIAARPWCLFENDLFSKLLIGVDADVDVCVHYLIPRKW